MKSKAVALVVSGYAGAVATPHALEGVKWLAPRVVAVIKRFNPEVAAYAAANAVVMTATVVEMLTDDVRHGVRSVAHGVWLAHDRSRGDCPHCKHYARGDELVVIPWRPTGTKSA
jgi:hypothetical protein